MGDGDQHARAGACFGRVFAYQKVFSTPSLNDAHVGGDSSSARATGRATSQVVAIRRMTATSVVAMGEATTSIAGTDRAMLMLFVRCAALDALRFQEWRPSHKQALCTS